MKPFEIYNGPEEGDEDTDNGEKQTPLPLPARAGGLDEAFVVYDDNAPSPGDSGNGGDLWDRLTASNERLTPEAEAAVLALLTPRERGKSGRFADSDLDIVTPIRALSFEQTGDADQFTPMRRASRSNESDRGGGGGTSVRPGPGRFGRVQRDLARDTVSVNTPHSGRQSLMVRFPGTAAIDNTKQLTAILRKSILVTRSIDASGETRATDSEINPVVKNHGKKGVTCKFMRVSPVSKEENADARVRPNLFETRRVDAPENLGVFTVIPAYFKGTRKGQGDVVTIEPCNLMYSLTGSDVTVVQPGTVEHVSTVNHVILTLLSSGDGRGGARPLLKLAIHKRVWAYGLQKLTDTQHFCNIPLKGDTFDCSITAKVVAASPASVSGVNKPLGADRSSVADRRVSLAYVFITGVKFTFPPSVRALSVEARTPPPVVAATTTTKKLPVKRDLFSEQ